MFIRFVEDIYADFLYDCYIANRHLTDEDWEWYGREEHHIELPERDGGVLTPLNSQVLTTYQHWIAGVLQSEVLGKCCFACVPKDVLPTMFEMLRAKWQSRHSSEMFEKTGYKISNRGKMWITNGTEQKLIHRSESIPGGWKKGRLPHTEETRQKISEAGKGRVFSEETILKLKARENVWIGRKHTQESREKMSNAAKNRDPSTRVGPDMSGERNPNYGKTASPETRQKQSEAQKNRFNQSNGLSEETKQKMKQAQQARRLKEKGDRNV
jgi:hypothetical protein